MIKSNLPSDLTERLQTIFYMLRSIPDDDILNLARLPDPYETDRWRESQHETVARWKPKIEEILPHSFAFVCWCLRQQFLKELWN